MGCSKSQHPEWASQYLNFGSLVDAAVRFASTANAAWAGTSNNPVGSNDSPAFLKSVLYAGGGIGLPGEAQSYSEELNGNADDTALEALDDLLTMAAAETRRCADFVSSQHDQLRTSLDEIENALDELDASELTAGGGVVEVEFHKERKALLKATRTCHHGGSLLADFAIVNAEALGQLAKYIDRLSATKCLSQGSPGLHFLSTDLSIKSLRQTPTTLKAAVSGYLDRNRS